MHSQIFKPRKAHIKLHYVVTVPPGSVVVQSLSRVGLFETPWTAACQASLSFTISWSLLGDSYPLSQWCYLTISSSTALFSFCLQYFPASRSFPMSWLLTSGCQSIGASALASVFVVNIQCWFPFGLTGLISLLFKGLSRVFFGTTVWKHQSLGVYLCEFISWHQPLSGPGWG